jgi:hypothetical protein
MFELHVIYRFDTEEEALFAADQYTEDGIETEVKKAFDWRENRRQGREEI